MNNSIKIDIPECENGIMKLQWEDNFSIKCDTDNSNAVVISANTAGLISLARHLLTLAQNDIPEHTHIHLDENNSLENSSLDLIIAKCKD